MGEERGSRVTVGGEGRNVRRVCRENVVAGRVMKQSVVGLKVRRKRSEVGRKMESGKVCDGGEVGGDLKYCMGSGEVSGLMENLEKYREERGGGRGEVK